MMKLDELLQQESPVSKADIDAGKGAILPGYQRNISHNALHSKKAPNPKIRFRAFSKSA
jgi:hypothetical protein